MAAKKPPRKKPPREASVPDVLAEYAGMARDVNVREFILDVVGKGVPDIDVSEAAIAGEIRRGIDGASEITLTVHDQARIILKSGALQDTKGRLRAADVNVDGMWFRLVGLSKQGDDLILKLEDRRIARLRQKVGPSKAASRAKVTRAQYILTLVRSVKADKREPVHIHELKKKQPIRPPDDKTRKRITKAEERKTEKDSKRGRGFADNAHTKLGVKKGQLDNIEVFMDEAELLKAGDKAILAGLVAGFGESGWSKAAKDWKTGTHQGVFQSDQNNPEGIPPNQLDVQSHHFLVGGRTYLKGGAIRYAKDHPDASPGAIALAVEISDAAGASHYDKYLPKARKILAAWGGSTGGGDTSSAGSDATYYKRYEFKVDEDETYWDAIQRMAKEVEWRAFVSGRKFFYISEEDLFRSRVRRRFSEDTPGVNNIDFNQDTRRRADRATVDCRIDAWAAPPGTVVELEDLGPASEDRWLVEEITRNLFSPDATINLRRAVQEKMEPRSEPGTRKDDTSDDSTGSADVQGGFTAREFIDHVVLPIARDHGVNVTSASVKAANGRHSQLTSSGNVSDHKGDGIRIYAADLGIGTSDKKGTALANDLCEKLGLPKSMIGTFTRHTTKEGYDIQLLWHVPDHYDHVHVGVHVTKPITTSPGAETKRKFPRREPNLAEPGV